jgi:hypothetical protein
MGEAMETTPATPKESRAEVESTAIEVWIDILDGDNT